MKQKYSSLGDMEDDMRQLWLNARTFNGVNFQVSGIEVEMRRREEGV